jgi:hypothetical protein
VSDVTVRKFENEQANPQRASLDVIRRALEAAGVEFIPENGGGAGVRLRKRPQLAKEQKTKREIEDMIRARTVGLDISHLEVRPDKAYGWHASVVAHPNVAGEYQAHVERIASELRALYDLKV